MHPRSRTSFVEGPWPGRLDRLYYETSDGWRAPLLRLPARPGATGEPVLLAHGLGAAPEALRYGAEGGLAGALRDAGFAVFLWSHRADGDALPPDRSARGGIGFDAIVSRDLPSAVQRVLEATGAKRAMVVGHGLGGQAALCWAAGRPEALAAVVAIAAPMRFEARSGAVRLGRALQLVPAAWRVPLRAAARASTPWVGDDDTGSVPGDRARGLLAFGTEDLPVGLLREILAWHDHGAPTTAGLDWREALVDAVAPLLVVCGEDDRVCPPAAARAAAERWGGPTDVLLVEGLDHPGLVFGATAPARVHTPVVRWLLARRQSCWLDASTDGTVAEVGVVG